MQVINYILIAFIAWFVGAFMMAWYDLDHPKKEVVDNEPVYIQNHYHLQFDENYIMISAAPLPPNFCPPKMLLDASRIRNIILESGSR